MFRTHHSYRISNQHAHPQFPLAITSEQVWDVSNFSPKSACCGHSWQTAWAQNNCQLYQDFEHRTHLHWAVFPPLRITAPMLNQHAVDTTGRQSKATVKCIRISAQGISLILHHHNSMAFFKAIDGLFWSLSSHDLKIPMPVFSNHYIDYIDASMLIRAHRCALILLCKGRNRFTFIHR